MASAVINATGRTLSSSSRGAATSRTIGSSVSIPSVATASTGLGSMTPVNSSTQNNISNSGFGVGSLIGNGDISSNLNSFVNNINQLFNAIANSSRVDYNNQLYKEIQQEQNEYNTNSAREAMQFSKDMAQRQMNFQEQMSNTSYQRAVDDLKKAGLNPVLAAFNGGASTPSGSSANGVALPSSSREVDQGYSTVNNLSSILGQMINNAPLIMLANAITGIPKSFPAVSNFVEDTYKNVSDVASKIFNKYKDDSDGINKDINPTYRFYKNFNNTFSRSFASGGGSR